MTEHTATHGLPALIICIPTYNDWPAVAILLGLIDEVAGRSPSEISVLLIDDGSTEPIPSDLANKPRWLRRITVLHLRRNVGHQRAIALGLCFVQGRTDATMAAVMDGDGEDCPDHVPVLVQRCLEHGGPVAVFAQRARRTERLGFRIGYQAYKMVHRLLIGRWVDIGNFSVVPRLLLDRLVGVSEIWNHYAAAVVHARLPLDKVPLPRGKRLTGKSKMNLLSLVTHGMSAISVYGDVVGVRMLCLASCLFMAAIAGVVAVIWIRLFTLWAVPGWATNASGLLLLFCATLLLVMIMLVQMTLQSRNYASFLPIRDWVYYVASERVLYDRAL
jgi:polyisoprenyl-phosphate glycosyltransferase